MYDQEYIIRNVERRLIGFLEKFANSTFESQSLFDQKDTVRASTFSRTEPVRVRARTV